MSAGNAVVGGAGGNGGDGNGNTANGGDFNSGDFSGNGGIAFGDNGNGGAGGNAIGGEHGHKSLLPKLVVFTVAQRCCHAMLVSKEACVAELTEAS